MVELLRFLLRGHRWSILVIILLGILGVGFALAFVYLSKEVIDQAVQHQSATLSRDITLLVLSLALQVVCKVASVRLTGYTGARMSIALQRKVFRHLLYTRWQQLSELHSGDVIVRMLRDTDALVGFFVSSLPTAITASIQLIGALLLLYYFSPSLALILGLGMPLVLLFSRLYYRRMRRYTDEMKAAESQITAHIQERLTNQTLLRTFERQESSLVELGLKQGRYMQAVRRQTFVSVFTSLFIQSAFSAGYITAFLWSVRGIFYSTVTFGMMTSFLQLVGRIQGPLNTLLSLLPTLVNARSSLDRLGQILALKTEDMQRELRLSGELELRVEGLSFRYSAEEPWVYRDFDLEAHSGQMIALMGRTGTGKTTLLRLLLGLVSPTEGRLELRSGGRSYPIAERTRSNFVYVPQGGSLMSGTIRENLLIGDDEASDERLWQALDLAVADFVRSLPEGLDTLIGERGVGLSEGQAQRIAIARALLRPGRILLLDEATSALDEDTEARFLEQLRRSVQDRLVIFITHHPRVAAACDQVVELRPA